jgi:Tfp pilus assembly protein PilF
LAALYAALHDDQKAVKYYTAASAALPQSVEPLLGQARVFARRATEGVTAEERAEAAREAEAVLLKAEAMAPTDRGPHLRLVRLDIASGERDKLNARMREAESRKGATSADDIVARALWELDGGQLAEADKRILKFRQDRPRDPRGAELAALSAERKGNWDDAAREWQAARTLSNAEEKQIDREPTAISPPSDYSLQLANAYLKAKLFHGAVMACRDAVKEDPYSAFRELRLAQAAVAAKLNWRQIAVHFARAAELSSVPKDLPPLFGK